MKRIFAFLTVILLSTNIIANDDIYDPATNQLTIPSITVNGIVYTDVVVTVGKIIKIGGQSNVAVDTSKNWTCSWTFNDGDDHNHIKYELTIHPSTKTITVILTGLTDIASFFSFDVDLVQGSKSSEVTFLSSLNGIFWTGDDEFTGGTIPTGVTKTGTLSRFPTWFNFDQPFSWLSDRNRHDCQP